jgi:hypothetical protein
MIGIPSNEAQNPPPQTAEQEWRDADPAVVTTTALVPVREIPPVIVDDRSIPGKSKRKIFFRVLLFLALAGVAAAGGYYWWRSTLSPVPAGIVWSNGRTDAEEIDIGEGGANHCHHGHTRS